MGKCTLCNLEYDDNIYVSTYTSECSECNKRLIKNRNKAMEENRKTASWRILISEEMENRNDSFENVIFSTLSNAELDVKFDKGYGSIEGKPFTLWTKTRVYFPTSYDGAEGCNSVPREPCDEITEHV